MRIPQIQILCCRTIPEDRLVALQQTPLARVQVPAPPSPRPLLDRAQVQPGKYSKSNFDSYAEHRFGPTIKICKKEVYLVRNV